MPRPSLIFDAVLFAKTQLNFIPDPRQKLVLDTQIHRGILNCSRQWGKSTICALKAVHHAVTVKNANVIIVSPSERQSSELVRKARSFATRLTTELKTDGFNRNSIVFPNGSRIVGFPASNERLRGFSASLLIVDEAAHVADDLYNTVRPFLAATNGDLWLMSTPNGKRGFFFDTWMNGDPQWTRISVPADQCDRITKKFLAEERSRMSASQFAQEYLCQFGDSESSLFCPDDIKALFNPSVEPLFTPLTPPTKLPWEPAEPEFTLIPANAPGWTHYVLGLDLGQARDHTAISVIEQKTFLTTQRDRLDFAHLAFSRLRLRHIEKIALRTSYTEIVDRIVEMVSVFNQLNLRSEDERYGSPATIVVDAGGCGAPILDMLRRELHLNRLRHPRLVGVNITAGAKPSYSAGKHNIPKRDLVTTFQIAIENQDFDIAANLPEQRELIRELARFERRFTAHGSQVFEAAKGHDDLVMSLLLSVYWSLRYPPPTMRNSSIVRLVPRSELNLSPGDLATLGIPNPRAGS